MLRIILLHSISILLVLPVFGHRNVGKDRDADLLYSYELLRKAENGSIEESIPLYRKAIEIMKKYDDDSYHRAYVGYANALSCSGRVFEAIQIYNIIISENYLNEDIIEKCVFQLSNLMLDIGQYNKVEQLLEPYVERTDMKIYPHLLSNYAAALAFQHKYQKALTVLSRIQIDNKTNLNSIILQNKAFIFAEAGEYNQACSYYADALPLFYGRERGIVEANYSMALARSGKFTQAINAIDRSLSILKTNKDIDYIRALRKKAEIYYLKGDTTNAYIYFKQFFECEKDWLISNLQTFNKQQRIDLWSREKDLLSECFIIGNKAPKFLLDVALFRRLTSILGVDGIDFNICNTKSLRNALTTKDAAIEFVRYPDLKGTNNYGAIVVPQKGEVRFVPLFNEELIFEPEQVATNSLFNVLRREDKSELNILYTDTIWSDRVWRPILASLPENVNNIYFAPDGIFHLWAIENMPLNKHDHLQLHRVTSLTNLINTKKIQSDCSEDSALVIGGLNYDTYSHNNVDSISSNQEALAYLQSQLGKISRPFNYLKGTRSEADTVAEHFQNHVLCHDLDESELKELFGKFKLVHVATHGYNLNFGISNHPETLNDSIPIDISMLGCGIALSGANKPIAINREDNLLSAREICDLDLSNVDFVVLSACQTAKGNVFDEGAAGLIRGLKNAGVKTVMATLWSVDDKSTMLFMQEFYHLLENGKSKHDAYIGAQNYLKNYIAKTPYHRFSAATLSRDKETLYHTTTYDAPYFWAPFILIDDF